MRQVMKERGDRYAENSGEKRQKLDVDGESDKDTDRLPKKKVAMLLGYCGTGYQGMQV